MFPLVKRVTFRDKLVELIPRLISEEADASDSSSSTSSIKRVRNLQSDGHQGEKVASDDDDAVIPNSPVQSWRMEERQWLWTLGKVEDTRIVSEAEGESEQRITDEWILETDSTGPDKRNDGKVVLVASMEYPTKVNEPSFPFCPTTKGLNKHYREDYYDS